MSHTWLTDAELRKVQKIVKRHCCNFTDKDGCLQTSSGKCRLFDKLQPGEQIHRCKWAEDAVLAMDADAERMYFRRLNQYLGVTEKHEQHASGNCKDCGKLYSRRSNRQTRCSACQQKVRRKSLTTAARKYRQSKSG